MLFVILAVVFGFVAFCMIALILLQEGKGGGIAAMGVPGMDSIIGARNPLRKLTVIFALVFLLLVLALGTIVNRAEPEIVPEGLAKSAAAAPGTPPDDATAGTPAEGAAAETETAAENNAGPAAPDPSTTETPLPAPAKETGAGE